MPAINVREFNKKLLDFGKRLSFQQVMDFQRKIVFQIITNAVFGTPVITGRARGGWQVSIGELEIDNTENDKEGHSTIDRAKIKIERSAKKLQIMYVLNNVEYISILEFGNEEREPRAMLFNALQAVKSQF